MKGTPHAIKLDGSVEIYNLQGSATNFVNVEVKFQQPWSRHSWKVIGKT